VKRDKESFVVANITDDLHHKLKIVEEEFEQSLGRRIALVAYEAEEK
jgi:hypothetical protein